MMRVISGNWALKPSNIFWKRGIKNVIRNISTATAKTSNMVGYSTAAITLDFKSLSRTWKSAICASTTSRNPPTSPADTIATYTRGKVSGNLAIESASVTPSTTESYTPFHWD